MLRDEAPQHDGERAVAEGQGLPERSDGSFPRGRFVGVRRVGSHDIEPRAPERGVTGADVQNRAFTKKDLRTEHAFMEFHGSAAGPDRLPGTCKVFPAGALCHCALLSLPRSEALGKAGHLFFMRSHCMKLPASVKGDGMHQVRSTTVEERALFDELVGSIRQDWRTEETAESTRERRRLLEPRADDGVAW
ncbi:hypothetical protein [Streptomyces sp. DSM 40907]|uniref:hypothetical protein n=1 Tax=Streptomyces kutzneri TaxID=3051179 RepID=UPI0028D575AB|nr:hypothetical protein [Streptomyces sp. DSM 40907]